MNKCLQCGRPAKHTQNDGRMPNGSQWMQRHDPKDLFCTMRCAALYGIRAAERSKTR